jgi:glycosyltransferase involved in cell wall biosynthesis
VTPPPILLETDRPETDRVTRPILHRTDGGERPRVCVVSDAAPGRNGVGTYYHDLSQHLQSHVAVHLISPTFQDGRWRGGLKLPLPGDRTQRLCLPRPQTLLDQFDTQRPDAVIVATPGPYGLMGMWAAKRRGARVIVGFHTHFEKVTGLYWDRAMGSVTRRYFAWSHRLLFRHGEVVLANSPEMAAEARRFGALNVDLIGTPLHRDFLRAPVAPPRPGLTDVLFAGRLSAEKNLSTVLAAAERNPGIRFHIAGDGPLRGAVEDACGRLGNLRYAGWLSRDGILAMLDAVDALVLPSHVESFGTAALEAMARGRLVIVSPSCGICAWPELAEGLFVMAPSETLGDTVRRVAALPMAERHAHARRSRRAAVSFDRRNLTQWLRLIREGSRGVP